jgi:hypothetical protein
MISGAIAVFGLVTIFRGLPCAYSSLFSTYLVQIICLEQLEMVVCKSTCTNHDLRQSLHLLAYETRVRRRKPKKPSARVHSKSQLNNPAHPSGFPVSRDVYTSSQRQPKTPISLRRSDLRVFYPRSPPTHTHLLLSPHIMFRNTLKSSTGVLAQVSAARTSVSSSAITVM